MDVFPLSSKVFFFFLKVSIYPTSGILNFFARYALLLETEGRGKYITCDTSSEFLVKFGLTLDT